jgi:glycosyltransferase involved in cell wall biosynthesis
MEILMFSKYFYPHVGGVEKHVDNITKILLREGHNVTIITESLDAKQKKVLTNASGVKIVRLGFLKIKYLGLLSIWLNILKNIDLIRKAEIIHCHDVFIWYLPFRFIFPFKPVYTTFHGYEGYPIKRSARIIRKISEFLSNGNICVGEFISKWYGTRPTLITYGAVDTVKPRKKSQFEYDAIFIGRLDEQTNILGYLEVVRLLRNKLPNFRLLVFGDGKYLRKSKELTNCKGFVSNAEKYISQANYAFVSRYLSILEAFINKRMVFALYDNKIKEDYLKMTPYSKWIVVEGSPAKLAEKLLYYKTHQIEGNKMIKSAYTWAQSQTWDNMVNNYKKLWGIKV